MIPAPEYQDISSILNSEMFSLGINFAEGIPRQHNFVCFIFFDQSVKRPPISDFLDNINMLNEYSGNFVHFFLPGVSKFGKNQGDSAIKLGEIGGTPIFHNVRAFLSFKDEFEQRIPEWSYEFGVDIILLDIVELENQRVLDFDSAIFFKVEEFIRLGIVDRTTELLGKIIKFRRDSKLNSAKSAKQLFQKQFGVNWFKGIILALFPKAIQDMARAQAVLGGGAALK